MSVPGVSMLMGAGALEPAPADVLDALHHVEIVTTVGERGSFMPQQQGTDYAYLRMLADWVVPGASGPRRDHERTSPPGVRAGSRRARRQGCGETIMSGEQSRYFGKYRGTVVNTVDPERRARLQATVPDVLGAEPSTWAMPSAPFAGSGAGFVAIPPVGAGVWIEFEQGNPDYPIWSGCWWGVGNELPTIVAASAQPGIGQVAIVTAGRNSLVISDLPGPTGGIALRTTTGAHISVTSTGIIIDNGQGAAITLSGNTVHIAGVRI